MDALQIVIGIVLVAGLAVALEPASWLDSDRAIWRFLGLTDEAIRFDDLDETLTTPLEHYTPPV